MSIPTQFTLAEIQSAFRDVYQKLEPLRSGNIDLSGRRIVGAGSAVGKFDYVTRFDLLNLLDGLTKAGVVSGRGETALNQINAVRLGAYATRGAAAAHPNSMFAASDRDYVSWVSNGASWSYHAGIHRDVFANRPTPESTDTNYPYFATDTFQRFYWSGSAWVEEIAPALLPFLGLTSSFPALFRSGPKLQVVTADNGGFSDLEVLDDPYDATGWNANIEVPTKNAIRDKFETEAESSGTWTPEVGATSYTLQRAAYVKRGKLVTINCTLIINVLGAGSATTITGMPFATKSLHSFSGTVHYFSGLAINVIWIAASLDGSNITFNQIAAAGPTAGAAAIFGDGARVDFTATYFTD